MTRREMREHCFKMLFGLEFYPQEEIKGQVEQYFHSPCEEGENSEGIEEILHQVEMSEEDRDFLTNRVSDISEKIADIDIKINEVAEGWKTKRMGKVELIILRQAIYEMKHDDEIPEKVAINEAVVLAKRFGGKDAPAFVNGILAKFVME